MTRLEKRFYKFKELRRILNVKTNGAISNNLTEWGYSFTVLKGKGIKILELPAEDAITEIREIVMRKYHRTNKFNAKAFACILFLLAEDEIFASAPYETKVKILKQKFGINIYPKTIYKWLKPMIDNGDLVKEDYCYWKTITDEDGNKTQIPVLSKEEIDMHEKYRNLLNEFYEHIKKYEKEDNIIKIIYQFMWRETKTVYYKSKKIDINGIVDKDLMRLYELVPFAIME